MLDRHVEPLRDGTSILSAVPQGLLRRRAQALIGAGTSSGRAAPFARRLRLAGYVNTDMSRITAQELQPA